MTRTRARSPRFPSLLRLLACLALAAPALAEVSSETIYFLQPDGRSYLVERSLRTPAGSHRFHLDKAIGLDDLRHVAPREFRWDDRSREDLNVLSFDAGGFTVIFPGRLPPAQLEELGDGEYRYRSWDGNRGADGRFGIWYSPGDFDDFSYTWILPDNIELLGYSANRDGEWVRRGNSVSFFASRVNNLAFELHYRVTPPTADGARDCPGPALAAAPAPPACAEPATPPAADDAGGCALDCDGDGVRNAVDACPGTAAGSPVDRHGCPVGASGDGDADGDGINDARDLCPGTASGARVDRAGCSLDTDKDGVPDGVDRCPATPEDAPVDAQGCPPGRG